MDYHRSSTLKETCFKQRGTILILVLGIFMLLFSASVALCRSYQLVSKTVTDREGYLRAYYLSESAKAVAESGFLTIPLLSPPASATDISALMPYFKKGQHFLGIKGGDIYVFRDSKNMVRSLGVFGLYKVGLNHSFSAVVQPDGSIRYTWIQTLNN